MKRLTLFLAVLLIGVSASALPRPAAANSPPKDWPPLLNCSDVNADGSVSMIDIAQVVLRFGTFVVQDDDTYYVPGEGYMLLYDVDGGGIVDGFDIGKVVEDFGLICPMVDTQVAAATLATMKYQDWSQAQAAGYSQTSQYVPQMGIHVSDNNYTATFDHTSPIGLIYKQSGGVPDELIGLWYVVALPEVCQALSLEQNPNDCLLYPTAEPEGFDGPEDNTDLSAAQRGWHTHPRLCVWPSGAVAENVPQETCQSQGALWFETFGWMVHLYNFIPNADGPYLMWNSQNLP